MSRLLCPLVVLMLLVSAPPALADRVANDVPYKSGDGLTEYERERCKLDLYLPTADVKDFPSVVWFYGGGLESGSKTNPMHARLATTLAKSGIACAVVDYRHSPKAQYPAYLDDAAASIAWTLAHIAEHGGNPKKVFVSGHSAGGYLAAQVGFNPQYLKAYGVSTDQLAGLIPFAPQIFTHFTIRKERGVPNPRTATVADEAAPVYHVRADAPRTLIILADKDWPARVEECAYFVAMLRHVKHPDVSMLVVPGRNHGTIAGKASEAGDPALEAMLAFIRREAITTQPSTQPAP